MDLALTCIVFDFDGLLMDTESTLLASWEFEWRQWGLTLDRDTFFLAHGDDVTADRLAALGQAVGPAFDPEASQARRLAYRDRLHEGLELVDGIGDWISAARRAGLRLAVASSSPVHWVLRNLRQVEVLDAFEVVAGGDEVDRRKPAPDVYLLALDRLGTAAAECIAVEDTPHGVDAAHSAGLACVAIPNPFVRQDAVAHAEVILTSARDSLLSDVATAALARRWAPLRGDGRG